MADGHEDEFTPKGEDEIRQEMIEEFDLDEDKDSERIEKLTKRELAHQEKLGTAIKQKRKHRETHQEFEQRLKDAGIDPKTGEKLEKPDEKKVEKENGPTEREKKLEKELEDIKLDQVVPDASDAIRDEIRDYAKFKGVSIREAAKSPYIKGLIDDEERKARNEEAANGDAKGGKHVSNKKLSDTKPEDYKNLSDEDWEKKKQQIREGKA